MKKLVALLLTIALLSLSVVTFAQSYPGDLPPEYHWLVYNNDPSDWFDWLAYQISWGDGEVTWTDLDDDHVNIPWIDRDNYEYDDNNVAKQSVELTLETRAFIPCYLEMKVTGNQGQTMLKSYGPGADTKASPKGYLLTFDNEIGGFVSERWYTLGHGSNPEINFDLNEVYIQGSDVFKVEVWANSNYKYEVEAGPLTAEDHDGSLPLQMRSGYRMDRFGGTFTFDEAGKICNIAEKDACEELTVYHQFRVPYTRNIAQGRYDGIVKFRAVTL